MTTSSKQAKSSSAKSGDAWKDIREPSEHQEQVLCVLWFRVNYPTILIFAIPNGGFRLPQTRKHLKEEGVVAGIPDMFIPAWNLWVELKRTKGGVTSPEQKKVIEYLNGNGHTAKVIHGFEEFKKEILSCAGVQEEGGSPWLGYPESKPVVARKPRAKRAKQSKAATRKGAK